MKNMQAEDLCLVTGVSGYLGSWVAERLRDQGFRVRGSVRSLGDTERSRRSAMSCRVLSESQQIYVSPMVGVAPLQVAVGSFTSPARRLCPPKPTEPGVQFRAFAVTGKMTDMTDVIRKNFGHMGFKPWVLPNWLFGVLSLFSSQAGSLYSKLSQPNADITKWPDVYRYRHIDLEEIVNALMEHD